MGLPTGKYLSSLNSRLAVEFMALLLIMSVHSRTSGILPSNSVTWWVSPPTKKRTGFILFWVNVPVLSVHITVTEPMVSDASSFFTRQLALAILRIFNARLMVTIMGSPSGTATTIIVTAIIKNRIKSFRVVRFQPVKRPDIKYLALRETKINPATDIPT